MTTIGLWAAWCLATLGASALLTRWLIDWTTAWGVVDRPNGRSSHTRITPRGGGLAIVAVVCGVALVIAALRPDEAPRLGAAMLPALAVAAVSWADDVRSLRHGTRLAVHLAAAVAATALLGPVLRVDLGSLGMLRTGALAWPLTVLWIVGLTNAFNFMDGSDGIAGLTACVAGAALASVAAAGSPAVAVVAAAFAAGALGFLTRNWEPARIFMGDVGSTTCGFLVATLPLALPVERVPAAVSVAVAATAPFILDTAVTLLRRMARRENLLRPHRGHFYQRLVIAGWSHRAVASLYGGLAAGAAAAVIAAQFAPQVAAPAFGAALVTIAGGAAAVAATVAAAERAPGTQEARAAGSRG